MRLSLPLVHFFLFSASIALPTLAAEPARPLPEATTTLAAQAAPTNDRTSAPIHRRSTAHKVARLADATPPVISSFGLPATATVGQYGTTMAFTFKGSDNISGLNRVQAVVVSPSGLNSMDIWLPLYGELHSDIKAGHYLQPSLEPGVWRLQSVSACDYYANCTVLTGAELQTIKGRHQVEVRNAYFDITPPTLSQGMLTTIDPIGSRGMVIAEVVAQDTGNPRASGVYSSVIELCQIEPSSCVVVTGYVTVPSQVEAKNRGGSWIELSLPGGTYHIATVTLTDHNGNRRKYTSRLFGGDTDFTGFFNVTTLPL